MCMCVYVKPYSRKLSRQKLFTFFTVSEPSVKGFSTKFCGRTYIIIGTEQSASVCVCVCVCVCVRVCVCVFVPERESFLPRKSSAIQCTPG